MPIGLHEAPDPASPASTAGQPNVEQWLRLAAQIAAAGFLGFGIILWIAANWDGIGKPGRFLIVGGALAVAVALAFVARLRIPALLAAFLAAGGLLALIGQTYQTGADAWSLFALWAALTLPWALAARHDMLWTGWGIVAMTAIELWLASVAGGFLVSAAPAWTLAAWAMSVVLAALLSPWSPIREWTGPARWAFRVVTLLAISMITQHALGALFDGREVGSLYGFGLAGLAAIAAAFALLAPLDMLLLAMTALGVDVALICGLVRAVLWRNGGLIGASLLVGLASAAIVAGTGAGLLRIASWRHASLPRAAHLRAGGTWPVTILTAIGALFASVPLLWFLGLLFGAFLTSGAGAYAIGIGAMVAACAVIRAASPASFVHQLGVIGLAVGYMLLGYGLYRDSANAPAQASLLLAVTAEGLAFAVGDTWVGALLGAVAAILAALFLSQVGVGTPGHLHTPWVPPGPFVWTLLLAAGSLALLMKRRARWLHRTPSAALPPGIADRFHTGFVAGALIGSVLAAGPTFLAGAQLGTGPWRALPSLQVSWASLSPLSAIAALAAAALVLVRRPQLATPLGLGVAAVAVAVCAVVHGLGGLALALAVASLQGRRPLALGAAVAAVWVIGSFYYWLGWPLAAKAELMVAAGLALAGTCWLAGLVRPAIAFPHASPASAALATGLIALGAVATAGFAANAVYGMEQVLAEGRVVYLPLAPVDPRSLMQGDYMALRFAMPPQREQPAARPGTRAWGLATLDARGVATIKRISTARPAAGSSEIVLRLAPKSGRWTVGSDAWFFKEGTASKWQLARFGEFRLAANGTMLLVGLADKDLAAIR